MNPIQLDKNYRIIKRQDSENEIPNYFKDEIGEMIERVLGLKKSGKIDNITAKRLIKILLAKNLKKDILLSINNLLGSPKSESKSKILFLRLINKTIYG